MPQETEANRYLNRPLRWHWNRTVDVPFVCDVDEAQLRIHALDQVFESEHPWSLSVDGKVVLEFTVWPTCWDAPMGKYRWEKIKHALRNVRFLIFSRR